MTHAFGVGGSLYFNALTQHPLLSVADERRLLAAVQRGQTAARRIETTTDAARRANLLNAVQSGAEARDKLVCHNTRLVAAIAKHYQGLGLPLMDLIQEGVIGLMTAIERFELSRGLRLSTYASWWIRQAIHRAVTSQGRTIRLPEYQQQRLRKLARAEELLYDHLGREPNAEELAGMIGLTAVDVQDLKRQAAPAVSLDGSADDDAGWVERLSAEGQGLEEMAAERQLADSLGQALAKLTPQQTRVLALRYGLNDSQCRTLREVGAILGRTTERVRQIEDEAFGRLRNNSTLARMSQEYLR